MSKNLTHTNSGTSAREVYGDNSEAALPRTKREVESQEGSAKDNLVLRCGDCMHYKGTANPVYGEPCHLRGVRTFATAPACYTPDTSALRSVDQDAFASLLAILTSLTPRQTRVLMGLMKNAGKLEKHGLSFLQKVYFRIDEDYLANYCSGRVLGLGVGKTIMVVGETFLKNPRKPFVAALMLSSILTADKFKSVRSKLVNAGKLSQPGRPQIMKKVPLDENWQPPTIETSQEHLEVLAQATAAKVKSKRDPKLEFKGKRKTFSIELEG